jgi:prevent-host-death family protein
MCYMGTRKKAPAKKVTYRIAPSSIRASRVREAGVGYAPETVGVRELRQNLSVYLDQVKQGRALWVTEHGQEVALLRPVPAKMSSLDRLVLEGKATAPTRRIADLPPPLDVKLDKPLSQILIEMRDEEYE